ncbi:poly [ADP-ribose] polymerase 2 isoform X4 [Dermochelys coriacea]|uniref:poly [ADP-ribose] polymerase 2 isoform X4 n=2 Tax=Dermochelys coriacea TaxID=27794 RepID=UPI001CA98C9F|nr:poly [ADP-ribose] polymerase 2 isoform X4 [Dermochelys coriacea]
MDFNRMVCIELYGLEGGDGPHMAVWMAVEWSVWDYITWDVCVLVHTGYMDFGRMVCIELYGLEWCWSIQGCMDCSRMVRMGLYGLGITVHGSLPPFSLLASLLVTPRMSRKRRAAEAGDVGLALELRWEWQDPSGTWHCFVPEQSEVLTQAARVGKPSVTVGSCVDLQRMVQQNGQTGQDRCVAAAVQDQDSYAVDDYGASEPSSVPGFLSPQQPSAPKRPRDGGASPNPGAGGESTEIIKTLIMKGKAPVDPECLAKLGKAHVYCEGDDVYDVMLNQTNLQFNNNKFYVLQLLEDDGSRSYSVWMRWGRVGRPGQHMLVSCAGDLAQAKEIFTKKFLDKTKNHWAERGNFQKVLGKYDLLHMDSQPPASELSCVGAPRPQPASQLDPRVQALLELVCDLQAMEEMVLEMKYDTKKAPLGKLTVEQIHAGFQSLQKVEAVLRAGDTGRALLEACNEFYTRVPHDFGLRTPPLIRTRQELQEKVQLLEALGEIQIAIRLVHLELHGQEHPMDQSYRKLGCELHPLDRDSARFQVLERYLLSTHAPTHRDYSMELLEAFALRRAGEPPFCASLPNRMLLWHGSRLGNWVGILSQGLRVAPPEAPVTGYMFGKGIYFADMSSKSANYCFASRQRDVGLLLLCEVALGECQELLEANAEARKLPPGKHSTKGLGKLSPAPANSIMLDGAAVPLGPAVETGVTNPHGYTLNYNEFVVYDPGQVRMRYLLQVRFNFMQLW